jgi:hypothetical protein
MKQTFIPFILLTLAGDVSAQRLGQVYRSDYTMTEPVQLTSGTGKNEDPCLLRAKDGTIYMAWFSDRGGNPDIYINDSKDGGRTWSEPAAIIQGGGVGNFYPSLAQTNDGAFHLTWFRIDAKRRVFSVWYSNSGDARSWSKPRAVTPLDKDYNWAPMIAASRDDSLWIAWASGRTGNKDIFLIQSKDGGRTWQDPVQVTRHPFHDDLPKPAQKPDGTFILVWTRYKPSSKADYLSETADIYYATSRNGTAWSDPIAITRNDYTDSIPELHSNIDRSEYFAVWCSAKGSFDLSLSDVKARPMHLLASSVEGYSLRVLPLTDQDYLVVWVRKLKEGLHIYSCQIRKPR